MSVTHSPSQDRPYGVTLICKAADKRSKLAVRGGGMGRRGECRVGMRADVRSEGHARCPEAHRRARIAQG